MTNELNCNCGTPAGYHLSDCAIHDKPARDEQGMTREAWDYFYSMTF